MAELGTRAGPGVVDGNGSAAVLHPRAIRRRRGMPGSRAVVGGLLVAAAAVGLFAATVGTKGGRAHSYVVARQAVTVGSRLSPSDLRIEPIDLPPRLRGRAFDDVAALVGTTAVSPLAAGELVQASAVVAGGGDGPTRQVSFPVERGHLSATLKEGERVDVLATFGTGDDATTRVVLRQAVVVSLDRAKAGLADSTATVVTVALPDDSDELAMAHAVQLAKVTVVRATGAATGAGATGSYRLPSPSAGANGG